MGKVSKYKVVKNRGTIDHTLEYTAINKNIWMKSGTHDEMLKYMDELQYRAKDYAKIDPIYDLPSVKRSKNLISYWNMHDELVEFKLVKIHS